MKLSTMHTKYLKIVLIKCYTRLSKSKSIKMLQTRIHTRAKAGNLALKVYKFLQEKAGDFLVNFSLDDNMVRSSL